MGSFSFQRHHLPLICFFTLGALVLLGCLWLRVFSPNFSYDFAVKEMPIGLLVVSLVLLGLVFVALRFVIPRIEVSSQKIRSGWFLFAIFMIGLAARLILMNSEPILEDDYQRYLWDGAVLANGLDPYEFSPEDILKGRATETHHILADVSHPLLPRVNHASLRTIYPIGAEFLFALSSKLAPFSLLAWRGIILFSEILVFGLLVLLLRHLGRNEIWISLYWWNPLVIKELVNSAHMEGVLVPFLLAGFYLALQKRLFLSSTALSLAASIKIWPALLLPLVWRRCWPDPLKLVLSVSFALLIGGAIIAPFILSGLNESSGLVAYAQKWSTNSAFFPAFEWIIGQLSGLFYLSSELVPFIARGIVAAGLLSVLLYLFLKPKISTKTLFFHFFIMSLLIFMFSPAQFPWYFIWIAPFLVFYPLWGFVILVPMMALYYVGFALHVSGDYTAYRPYLMMMLWIPVWLAFAVESRLDQRLSQKLGWRHN